MIEKRWNLNLPENSSKAYCQEVEAVLKEISQFLRKESEQEAWINTPLPKLNASVRDILEKCPERISELRNFLDWLRNP